MKGAFADSLERLESVTRAKGDRIPFGIGDHADATQGITLIQRERQDMAEERAPHAETLGPLIHTESREPEDGKRVGGQAPSHSSGGKGSPLQASDRDGREPEQPAF